MVTGKDFPKVKTKRKKVVYKAFGFGAEGNDRTLVADEATCVDTAGGKLKPACLWEAFYPYGDDSALYESGSGIVRAVEAFYSDNGEEKRRFLYVSGKNRLYGYYEKMEEYVSEGIEFSAPPTVVSMHGLGGDENLLFCSSDGAYFYDLRTRECSLVLEQASTIACAYHDRAFVAKGGAICFSAPLSFTDWADSADGGGYLDLYSEKGEIVGLVPFEEQIYVFFERGISVLSAKGSARDFSVEELPYDGKEILKGSAGKAGPKLVFLTVDGGYALVGKEVKRLLPNADFGEIDGEQVCDHQSFSGRSYVTYFLKNGKKRLFCYDGNGDSGYFVEPFPFESVTASKDKLIGSVAGKTYILSDDGSIPAGVETSFKVKATDFGVSGEKVLKSIKLKGKGKVRLAVSGERGGHTYLLELGTDRNAMVCPLLKGRYFDLKLIPLTGELSALEAELVVNG